MAEGDVPVVVDIACDEVEAVSAPAAGKALRWTNVMSGFVLRRMCQLITSGVRTDKGFKEVHLNTVAKDLQEFLSIDVTGTQVYNHLRKWRQRWVKVSKLRELSGAHWDDDNFMILLEQEHYNGHVKAHPKDADFLNKPIDHYQEMLTIFGSGMATGKYAMASSEPLGCFADFVDTTVKHELVDDEKIPMGPPKESNGHGDGTPTVGSKRKRSSVPDPDNIVLSNLTTMTAAVNNVADAIRAVKPEIVHPDLYGAVMYMPGFLEEALMLAFNNLVDNKAQGIAFVGMSEAHRVLWLRTFLAKHYNA